MLLSEKLLAVFLATAVILRAVGDGFVLAVLVVLAGEVPGQRQRAAQDLQARTERCPSKSLEKQLFYIHIMTPLKSLH